VWGSDLVVLEFLSADRIELDSKTRTPTRRTSGVYSCNISLTVGVNLLVVHATDIAGNVAGSNFHVSLTGSLPAATSLQVTPTGVNMVVGNTQQFTVVDQQSRPRTDATWSVDNTSIATIDTNSSPMLTAVSVERKDQKYLEIRRN